MSDRLDEIHTVLGVRVHTVTADILRARIMGAANAHRSYIIGHHNLHSVHACQQDSEMRAFYQRADLTFADGIPVVLAGRLQGLPFTRAHRMTSLDWLPPLLERLAEAHVRVAFVGGTPDVVALARTRLETDYPDLPLLMLDGYFDLTAGSRESMAVLERLRAFQPRVVFACMGMPRQEHWILRTAPMLDGTVMVSLGGFLDYIAGAVRTPPRWAGPLGLEWCFRLMAEPQRLWRRYLVEPLQVLPLLARDLLRSFASRYHS